jgi:murein L,D-transpeptidase YafK
MQSSTCSFGITKRWTRAAIGCAILIFAVPLMTQRAPTPQKADSILILKKDHVLELLKGGKVIRTYKVALGRGGLAPKEREGDGRTPEGHYIIDSRNAESHYHKALHISYPNAEDSKRAAKLGVAPGGAIMIHGLPNGMGWLGAAHRLYDWTLGCIAVTDQEIDEIWDMAPTGTPVEIRP